MPDNNQKAIEEVADYLVSARRFDAKLYDETRFAAVLAKRFSSCGVETAGEYIDQLAVRPIEFTALLTELVKPEMNSLFSDPESCDILRNQVFDKLTSSADTIRIWVPACGHGYDVFAVAMLFAEALGGKPNLQQRLKIFATEADETKLSIARQGKFQDALLKNLPNELKRKYFSEQNGRFSFQPDLRRLIIFGRHDLLTDAPIARMDFVCFRYSLCGFDLEKQQRALSRMRFSLKDHGFLLVGEGEIGIAQTDFNAVADSSTLFTKARPVRGVVPVREPVSEETGKILHETFDEIDPAQLVIDGAGIVSMANAKARSMFSLLESDIGRPLQDMEVSYRPVELRSVIEEAQQTMRPVVLRNVEGTSPHTSLHLDVHVVPLIDSTQTVAGTSIQFFDVTASTELNSQLVALNDQVQSANEELQSAHEELLTANEELQSTNEELETINEELESTNEELETMNEELQSTNNELELLNEEQRRLAVNVEHSNRFVHSILGSLQAAVIVLDPNLVVLAWNRTATDFWGLSPDKAKGKNFISLDIGLPVETLAQPLRDFLSGKSDNAELAVTAHNRRGKQLECLARISRIAGARHNGLMLIISETSQEGNGSGD